MKNIYDIIVIGAGSIGLPTAYNLAKAGMKVLVLEAEHSPGQGNNKKSHRWSTSYAFRFW